jgi:hypothetical protein
VDISGTGNNGTLNNGAAYSSTHRALTFDGASDEYINISDVGNPSGNWSHSCSFWVKPQYDGSGNDVVFRLGPGANNEVIGFLYNGTAIGYYFYGNDFYSTYTLEDKWYHITLTYDGNERNVYINGGQNRFSTTTGGGQLNLGGNDGMRIGTNQASSAPMTGSISNFKLWGGVALTAEEVAMEYALGRTGKSLNLTDTSLCLGGTAPRAQLDVRGSARFGGIMSYSVPYYFAQQENTGGYAYDEPIVYKTNVVTNYPGSFYSSATNNGYYIPPLPGVYQVHMTAIANGAGSIYIQKFNYVTDSVILYHDKTHFNFTSGGWESISASGLISIDDPGTQAIRIFADGSSGNGIWAYNSYHGCVSIVWVSNI